MQGVESWNRCRKEGLINTRADLTNANLSKVNLEGVNFFGTDLSGADLSGAYLVDANLVCAILTNANLEGANLASANVIDADFTNANLKNVNFHYAEAQTTIFESATLTGACIHDWNISSETNFNHVICDYIYLKPNRQERRPSDPNTIFASGDFAIFSQKASETVDLIFSNGIDWQVFLTSFENLQIEYNNERIEIQAIEKKSNGILVRIQVSSNTNKAIIEKSFWRQYKPLLKAKQEQIKFYKQEIESKRQENTKLMRMIEKMAEKDNRTIKTNTYYEQSGNLGIGHNEGEIKDRAKIAGVVNEAQQQNLARAAADIQQLLEQLSLDYPTETLSQKAVVAEKVIKQIESNSKLKQRVINAVKAGSLGAFEKAIDNPIGAFVAEGIKGWQEID